tara:strand:- start:412 stop:879 length:468 start_codon:yes stop_codon:yes gene_type:complete
MNGFILARVIHVLAVVIWIGGVAMVTMVILPAIKKLKSKKEQLETFEALEGRFAKIAKLTTILTALSGFYMLEVLNAWHRYLDPSYWWLHAMTLVWLIFTFILFVFEPLLLHRLFKKFMQENPEKTIKIMQRAHWVLLILSLTALAGGVAGSHGL